MSFWCTAPSILLPKCAKRRFYPFAMPLTVTLRCLARDFCNSLHSPSPRWGEGRGEGLCVRDAAGAPKGRSRRRRDGALRTPAQPDPSAARGTPRKRIWKNEWVITSEETHKPPPLPLPPGAPSGLSHLPLWYLHTNYTPCTKSRTTRPASV